MTCIDSSIASCRSICADRNVPILTPSAHCCSLRSLWVRQRSRARFGEPKQTIGPTWPSRRPLRFGKRFSTDAVSGPAQPFLTLAVEEEASACELQRVAPPYQV